MDLPLVRRNRPSAPAVVPLRPWVQRAARFGLWSLIAIAAAGGVGGLLLAGAPAQAPTSQRTATPVPPTVVTFAEHAVRQWLTATPSSVVDLTATFLAPPEVGESQTTGRRVASVSAIEVRTQQDHYWAVTVAVELGQPSTPEAPRNLWHFQLGIVEVDGNLMAVETPALIAAPRPPLGPLPEPATLGTPEEADAVTATVDGFLRTMLTGGGDISRYLAPGTEIEAVSPPPFARTRLTGQAITTLDQGGAEVRVEVEGTTADDSSWTLAYEVVLAQRDERWEVTAVSGAPTLTTSASSRTTSTSGSTPPSNTTTAAVSPEPGA